MISHIDTFYNCIQTALCSWGGCRVERFLFSFSQLHLIRKKNIHLRHIYSYNSILLMYFSDRKGFVLCLLRTEHCLEFNKSTENFSQKCFRLLVFQFFFFSIIHVPSMPDIGGPICVGCLGPPRVFRSSSHLNVHKLTTGNLNVHPH